MTTAGGDSSSTGSKVQADIDHREVSSVPPAKAPAAGSSRGAQKAAAANLRSRSAGQIMSATVARLGRAASMPRSLLALGPRFRGDERRMMSAATISTEIAT